jgi:aryl-alcohol dehydrogenase-like predicted oxidoreductase
VVESRPLGTTGLTVSRLCLGAMMFGSFGNPDSAAVTRIVHRALDAGIDVIDTADGYSDGESEELLAAALTGGRRDRVTLAVKFGGPFRGEPHTGASSAWIVRAVEGSLRRLRTDVIDLYQLGVPDPGTDIEETIGALSDLVDVGKIRAFGASKVPPSHIVEAQWAASRIRRGRFASEQAPYSLVTRAVEYDLLPTAQRYGMGVLGYSPLDRGWLTGRHRRGGPTTGPGSAVRARGAGRFDTRSAANAAKVEAVESLASLADAAGLTLIQLAVAFAVRHPAVTTAIIGPRTMDHLEDYLAADGVELSDDVLDRIDEIVPPGTTVAVADNMWAVGTRALDPARRRRPPLDPPSRPSGRTP